MVTSSVETWPYLLCGKNDRNQHIDCSAAICHIFVNQASFFLYQGASA